MPCVAIVREVKIGEAERLTELLKKYRADQLEPDCYTRALTAATHNDDPHSIIKLIVKGANNMEECMEMAIRERKPHSQAMLLLVKAAITGNKSIVQKLFGDAVSNPSSLDPKDFNDDQFAEVQQVVLSGKVSTVVPIDIARRNGNNQVREVLLLKTDVNQEEGSVFWYGLRLLSLDISWLRRISWVKRLRLARNGFKSLPQEMGVYLKQVGTTPVCILSMLTNKSPCALFYCYQVVRLDLQHNELSHIPHCLLKLPSLSELHLGHNSLEEIPDVVEWSPCLTVLDLSHNQLSSLPINVIAPAIRALNLSHNYFRKVPLCICSFTTLHSLNLSENQDIHQLPAEMGQLSQLSRLGLSGVNRLNDPPRNLLRDPRDCIRYLNSKLRCAKGFYKMKLMLVGRANRGKTTLVARLQGKDCGHYVTVGVDVSEWWYKPSLGKNKFQFSIWDFGGLEEYYATHQCFLTERSLYLLLFNLKHKEEGVQELRPWLNNIALRAPNSLVIIVGTHLDEVNDEERAEVDQILQSARALAITYKNKLKIAEILPVGLTGRIENIGLLKDAIYTHAANYTTRRGQLLMGQKIPASYHLLDKRLEGIQEEVRRGDRGPIMHAEEFKSMVLQMNLPDIHDDEELKTATLFLTDIGALLHYDERSHNLNELYFVDPRWLCDMMAKVVTIREMNPFLREGFLQIKDIPFLFRDKRFPLDRYEQYLALLDRFEIALPLDNKRVLVPSMLPASCPKEVEEEYREEKKKPYYKRLIIFKDANTPPGFWSRLLSRIMHSVQKVTAALDVKSQFCSAQNDVQGPFENGPPTSSTTITVSSNADVNLTVPNFPAALPLSLEDTFADKDLKFHYWREGVFYRDPGVMFRIESLANSQHFRKEEGDGVLLIASPTKEGTQIVGQLVDIVLALINEWYPGLQDIIEQCVLCFECVKQGRPKPYEFQITECLTAITRNEAIMECGYYRNNPPKNHTVELTDIVPDLLLQDIDAKFLLKKEDIIYKEDKASLLGKGGYGKVYRGECHGKVVAIKKYLTRNEEAFSELRSEAKLLQQSHHPCLVCLEGVCVYPMALVLELAPLGALSFPLLKKKIPIHRLTIFRIALEVAAALRFVHKQGIIFRYFKADNVFLWTLNPDSLCHCKITDFGIATHLSPVGAKGLQGTKGFIAPEVLHVGKRKQRSTYDHKADAFSFAMFLYQMIARRHPYHDIPGHRIDASVENGERPKLLDVDHAHFAYYYLTILMESCWRDKARDRPDDDVIMTKLCLSAMQSTMAVTPIKSRFYLHKAIAITPTDFTEASALHRQDCELWVCCDGAEGAEINMYNTHTMSKVNKNFIKDNQVQAIIKCNDHVWVGSRAGIEYGVVDIFSIQTKDLVHNIRMRENSVSCMACTSDAVYIGTLEGYCYRLVSNIEQVRANAKPRYRYVSENAVDGIACTQQCVWAAHTKYISFMNLDNLHLEGSFNQEKDAHIGQLSLSPDGKIVWSAHLGGFLLSAWDAHKKCHCFDVDTSEHMAMISSDNPEEDRIMTAMVPAEDCVWVGMATGHILVFSKEELLTWFHPYTEYVCFLAVLPCSGPCEMEKCMVASGGTGFQSMIEDLDNTVAAKVDEKSNVLKDDLPDGKGGYLVVLEAFTAKTYQQMKLIEENVPDMFDNHQTVSSKIREGKFVDGTHNMQVCSRDNISFTQPESEIYIPDLDTKPYNDAYFDSHQKYHERSSNRWSSSGGDNTISFHHQDSNFCTETANQTSYGTNPSQTLEPSKDNVVSVSFIDSAVPDISQHTSGSSSVLGATNAVIEVKLLSSERIIRITCPSPPQLKVVLSKLQVNASVGEESCRLVYFVGEKELRLETQEEFSEYFALEYKPQLWLSTVDTEYVLIPSTHNDDSTRPRKSRESIGSDNDTAAIVGNITTNLAIDSCSELQNSGLFSNSLSSSELSLLQEDTSDTDTNPSHNSASIKSPGQ